MATGFTNAAGSSVNFNTAALLKKLEDAADVLVAAELEKIADLAVRETEAIIRQVFVNDRSGRRRKERTQHLLGSIRSNVVHGAKSAQLIIWSTANPRKVGMLEYGTNKVYTIAAADGKFLYFPSNQSERPSATNRSPGLRNTKGHRVAYGSYHRKQGLGKRGELLTKAAEVKHGPYTGRHFMRRGAQNAIRKGLGRT